MRHALPCSRPTTVSARCSPRHAAFRRSNETHFTSAPHAGAQDCRLLRLLSQAIELHRPMRLFVIGPLWRATAKVDAGKPFMRGLKRGKRERPELANLARSGRVLSFKSQGVADEIVDPSRPKGRRTRHCPPTLSEWSQTEPKSSPFWGLRFTLPSSKPQPYNVAACG